MFPPASEAIPSLCSRAGVALLTGSLLGLIITAFEGILSALLDFPYF